MKTLFIVFGLLFSIGAMAEGGESQSKCMGGENGAKCGGSSNSSGKCVSKPNLEPVDLRVCGTSPDPDNCVKILREARERRDNEKGSFCSSRSTKPSCEKKDEPIRCLIPPCGSITSNTGCQWVGSGGGSSSDESGGRSCKQVLSDTSCDRVKKYDPQGYAKCCKTPKKKDCVITPGASFAYCEGDLYVRKSKKQSSKAAAEKIGEFFNPDDLRTLGESPRKADGKYLFPDTEGSSEGFSGSSSSKSK